MAEDISENRNPAAGEESGRGHHHTHHHHRHGSLGKHHKHSKKEKDVSEDVRSEGKHRFRFEEQNKVDRWRKIESTLTKHFLLIIGAIFLLNGIWFIVDSSENFRNFLSLVLNALMNLDISDTGPDSIRILSGTFDSILLLYIGIAILIFFLFRVSVKKSNFELEIISFFSWILLAVWWLVKAALSAGIYDVALLFLISTFLFVIFSYANMSGVYKIRSKWTWRTESLLIFCNYSFYFLSGVFCFRILGWGRFSGFFALLLAVCSFIPVYLKTKSHEHYNRIPYMIAVALIASSVIPLLIRINAAILLFAPLSVFFLLISKSTRNQASIFLSIGSLLVAIMIYLFQWIFKYIPAIFLYNILKDKGLVVTGLIAGLILIPVLIIDNVLLKKLTISVSTKFFSRSSYRKILKGVTLGVIYLWGFWLFSFLVEFFVNIAGMNYMILFTYNCLYFIILIPYLVKTGSSFLKIMLVVGVVSTLLFPTLIHTYNLKFRDLFFQDGFHLASGFGYHYLNTVLLLVLLFVMLKYKTMAFARKKNIIRGFWVFFILMINFVLISEFHHIIQLYSQSRGEYTLDTLEKFINLYDSLLLIVSTIVFLTVGFIQRFRFLRIFALVVFGCILIKILAIDIYSLETNTRVIVFIIIGTMAVSLSVFYPKFRKYFFMAESRSAEKEISDEKPEVEQP